MNENELEGIIEAVLFVAGEPVEAERLAESAGCDTARIGAVIDCMNEKYEKLDRGFIIKHIEKGYQLSANKKYAENIRKCLNLEKPRPLSQTLLETLAVVAYMQPVTKQQITDIRGADAKHAINKLMEKGLVQELGRHDSPGKPLLFGTTDEFLRKFGFDSVNNLQIYLPENEQENT